MALVASSGTRKKTKFYEFSKLEWLKDLRNENKSLDQQSIIRALDIELRERARINKDWVWLDVDRPEIIDLELEEYLYGLGFTYSPKRAAYFHAGRKSRV